MDSSAHPSCFFLWQENMATRVIIIEVDDLIAEMLLRTTERKKKTKKHFIIFLVTFIMVERDTTVRLLRG